MEAQNDHEARKREEDLTKTFWKLAHAKRAVSLVQTTCDLYLTHVENVLSQLHIPLLCSICVTYARPFTDNDGVGMISSKFARFLTKSFRTPMIFCGRRASASTRTAMQRLPPSRSLARALP